MAGRRESGPTRGILSAHRKMLARRLPVARPIRNSLLTILAALWTSGALLPAQDPLPEPVEPPQGSTAAAPRQIIDAEPPDSNEYKATVAPVAVAVGRPTGPRPADWLVLARITGRVVTAEGRQPPRGVKLATVCAGSSQPQPGPKQTGHFEIRPPPHPDLLNDLQGSPPTKSSSEVRKLLASGVRVSVPFPQFMPSCFLTARLEGYRNVKIPIGFLTPDDTTIVGRRSWLDIGLVILRPVDMPGGRTLSEATALAPPAARKAFESAVDTLDSQDPDFGKAISRLETAVELHPSFAAAWDLLAEARLATEDQGGALQALTRAINADPEYLSSYVLMLGMVTANNNWEEVTWLADRVLQFSPNAPLALYLSAVAATKLDNIELFQAHVESLKKVDDPANWPDGEYFMALLHESKSEFDEAAQLYAAVLRNSSNESVRSVAKRKLHEWGKLGIVQEQEALPGLAIPEIPPLEPADRPPTLKRRAPPPAP